MPAKKRWAAFKRVWEEPGYVRRMGKRRVVCTGHMWEKGFVRGQREKKGRRGQVGESEVEKETERTMTIERDGGDR